MSGLQTENARFPNSVRVHTIAALLSYGHELSLESVHSLSAVLTCGTVFLSQLETLTVSQHSDEPSALVVDDLS